MIKKAVADKQPIKTMLCNVWYTYLIKNNVLKEKLDDGSMEQKKCKVELMYPMRDWMQVWITARMKGLSNNCHSFLFGLVHNVHQTKSRLHPPNPRASPSPICSLCLGPEEKEEEENKNHIYSSYGHSLEAMNWLRTGLKEFDPSIASEKIVTLKINPVNAGCLF